MDEAAGSRKWLRTQAATPWSEAVAEAIVARTAAGESLRGMCRADPGLPAAQTVRRWARERADFRAAMEAAKAAAGRPFAKFGEGGAYCEETALEIFERLCGGEGMIAVCRDADMPAISTVRRWLAAHEEFAGAVAMARDIQADLFFERGWAMCEAATPETAYLLKVRLGHLRWHAGKLAPKKYGTLKAAEPEAGAGAGVHVTNVFMKTFVHDPDGGEARESDEPPRLIYSSRPGERPGDAPIVVQGEASWEGTRQEREDHQRALGEAAEAARAAGQALGGEVPARFWPAWFQEAYPKDWAQYVARLRASARARIAAMAGHGLAAEREDLIAAGWTPEDAARRCPVAGAAGG